MKKKKPKPKPVKIFPVSIKSGELMLTFWNIEQKLDQVPATQFVIEDKHGTFKLLEGKIYTAAITERIMTSIMDDPYVQGEINKRKFYKN